MEIIIVAIVVFFITFRILYWVSLGMPRTRKVMGRTERYWIDNGGEEVSYPPKWAYTNFCVDDGEEGMDWYGVHLKSWALFSIAVLSIVNGLITWATAHFGVAILSWLAIFYAVLCVTGIVFASFHSRKYCPRCCTYSLHTRTRVQPIEGMPGFGVEIRERVCGDCKYMCILSSYTVAD